MSFNRHAEQAEREREWVGVRTQKLKLLVVGTYVMSFFASLWLTVALCER